MSASREIEDLQSKLRVLERKRAEDRDRLLDLERLRQEREKLERIISRLEAKIKPMFDTQQELRARVRELEAEKNEVEHILTERTHQFEIITLDREVAEEQEERLRDELNSVKAQLEEALLEAEILKEENADFKKGSGVGERDFTLVIHLEEQNERLKEALIRLRDQTAADDAESRAEIKRLQRDVETYTQLQKKYEAAISQLRQTEEIADNLRQQLDIAFGAEQMLDELTVKNLALSEQVEEMRTAIQDLETLKEINDEIEANHLESAKQMGEEIDYRDMLLQEQTERMSQFVDTTADYEYTVGRFRELVASLQSDLDQLRTEKSMGEAESAEIDRRTREMYDLNDKLQASALKIQVKTIDLELRKLDAQEALDHLSIVKSFIPDSLATIREAIKTLLAFRRISFKSNLVVSVLRDNMASESEAFVTLALGTEICDKLTSISALCSHFATAISVCDVFEFENYGPLIEDIAPIEVLLDKAINSLRSYELNENGFSSSLQESFGVLESLGATKLEVQAGEMRTQECCGQLQCVQSYIDSVIIIAQYLLMIVAGELGGGSEDGCNTTYEEELARTFKSQAEALVLHAKSVRVLTNKAQAIVEEWKASLRAPTDGAQRILSAIHASSNLSCTYVRNVCFSVTLAFNKDVESYKQIGYSGIQEIMSKEAENTGDSGTFFSSVTATIKSMMTKMREFVAIIASPNGSRIYEKARAPWLVKVEELREHDAANKDARTKVVQLNEEINQLATQIRLKDKELEESSIKVSVLDSRLQKSIERLEGFSVVEREMAERAAHENALEVKVHSLRREMKALEDEAHELRKLAAVNESASKELKKLEGQAQAASAEEVDILNKQISALEATVRYLQDQGSLPSTNSSTWTDTAVAYLKTQVDERARTPAMLRNTTANKVYDSLIDLALTSDLVYVDRDSTRGWRPLRSQARYIAARQTEQYRNLAELAQKISFATGQSGEAMT
ncbi:dynein associated protein-domain-containing protein [Lipomyces tetrasporus]|uniref:Dynein associated protein-domain-containing protein n=1 Tax=Lipomyces tetrasporus TaxID=54092 RepID=A0AAD7VUF0_9ASCO|nr:dynein associated protein-domain-containing protein [Lipomyces tetrasporus]KAJ8101754.1 dynein associated protein-domain-containing protein [Lipomyces tetrasporus]